MDMPQPIPQPLQEKLNSELDHGERIVWAGRPKPRIVTIPSIFLLMFGLCWTGFTVLWTCAVAGFVDAPVDEKIADSPGYALFGIPFIFIGLLILSAPYWGWKKQLQTIYAVTDKRAISIEGGWSTVVRSFNPEDLHDVFRREYPNGLGDVVIKSMTISDRNRQTRTREVGFMSVYDVKSVERLLKDLAQRDR